MGGFLGWFVYTGYGVWGDCKEADWAVEGAFIEMCGFGGDRIVECCEGVHW